MSLTELIPIINDLSPSDKLSLLKLLAAQIPDADLQAVFTQSEYPIRSLYDATEAADLLMQMIQDYPETSTHA